ncbi:hypothetical protein VMCG_10540 [Cytospora schulzeri]|uniref:Uncharacterized protein n=1 Tax=Cytospora schulzeri TaxID=448051 RepID=A0A423VAE3_9PEZI|nr:hypothetical protein VMCG_10540 [Valsa malicola]
MTVVLARLQLDVIDLPSPTVGDAANVKSVAAEILVADYHVPTARTQASTNVSFYGYDTLILLFLEDSEAPLRDDSKYDYNMDVSRTLAQRGTGTMAHMSSSMAQYPQEMHLLSSGALPTTYRNNGYQNMNAKGYYSMGADWTDAYGADGSVEYALNCPPYQVINGDAAPMVSNYGHWAGRQKGMGQSTSVYMEPESGYTYNAGTTTGLVHRPAVSVPGDSSAYSFSSIAASLPSAGNNERLLPNPASVSRTVGGLAASYRTDGIAAGYSHHKSNHSSVSGGQTSPTSPVDVTGAAVAVGYAASSYDYTTVGRPSGHHGSSSADAYGAASAGGGETIFGDSDRSAATQGSAVDLTGYTYGGASPGDSSSLRRASSGSGLTSRSTAESTSSTGYAGSDGASTHGYHASSTSHGGHHHHRHNATTHHTSPRHGSHHLAQQQQLPGSHAVAGGTTYGEASGSSNSSNGVVGGVGGTAAADSHRLSVTSRR